MPELQAVRARGWANDYEESEIGAHGNAIGVPGMTQAVLAALEVIAPVERMPRTRHHQLATLRHMRTALEVMAKGGFP